MDDRDKTEATLSRLNSTHDALNSVTFGLRVAIRELNRLERKGGVFFNEDSLRSELKIINRDILSMMVQIADTISDYTDDLNNKGDNYED